MITFEDKTFFQIVLLGSFMAAGATVLIALLLVFLLAPNMPNAEASAEQLWFGVMLPFIGFGFGCMQGWGVAIFYSRRNLLIKWLYLVAGGFVAGNTMFMSLFLGDMFADKIFPTQYVNEPNPFLAMPVTILTTLIVIAYIVIALTWVMPPLQKAINQSFWG